MRAVVVAFLLFFAVGITACGSTAPVSLDGEWAADGFKAQIAGDNIEIYMVNGVQSSALYWDGTVPTSVGDGEFISVANQAALDKSLMGSQDDTKRFTYEDETLTFIITVMGSRTVVDLTRV